MPELPLPNPRPLPAALPAPASLRPLDPQALDARADAAVRGLMREGSSANTAASYRAAMRYWTAWFELRYGRAFALPLPETVVIQFVVDHAQRSTEEGLAWELPLALDQELVRLKAKGRLGAPSLNTLLQRLSVLSKAHELLGHPNPCRGAAVRELLSKTRRAYARRGIAPAKKEALTREPLQAMLDTCDDSLRGKRDRALLLFAWASGGRRRSEVVRATMENTQRTADGYLYTMAHSKTNQTGASRAQDQKPILGKAAQALDDWLAASAIRQGPIFRRVRLVAVRQRRFFARARDRAGAQPAGGVGGPFFGAQPALRLCHGGRAAQRAVGRHDGDDRPRQRGDGDGVFPGRRGRAVARCPPAGRTTGAGPTG